MHKSQRLIVACIFFLPVMLLSLPAVRASEMPGGEVAARVDVKPGKPGREIGQDFLGFSYEAPVLAEDTFDVHNGGLIRMLSNLGTGTLRYGGNSLEFTGWSRKGRIPASGERAVLAPGDLDRLFAFSRKTGWRVILGLNLGQNDPKLFADEAAYAVEHGGAQLVALEIGNEPDMFMRNGQRPSSWGYQDFRKEFDAYVQAIRAREPHAPISGPTTCCKAGFEWFPHFVSDEAPQLVFASHHIYPMSAGAKDPVAPNYPTIPRMLSPELMARVATEVSRLASAANAHHLSLRIAETNSASHGGKNGVSNVFAAALWGADYSFTLAEQGAAGLNFHGGFVCRGYTAICGSGENYVALPLYYGMLLFHSATPGRIVPVRIRTSANVTAHAVLSGNGDLNLVLINKDERQAVRVDIRGAGSYSRASVERLTGEALDSAARITFGGRAVDAQGDWAPGPAENLRRRHHSYQVELPAASALVARFTK